MAKVLVVIPAYNEEGCILQVVQGLKQACPEADYVVVNDCSTDGTGRALAQKGCVYLDLPVNLGIGGGVQTGYKYAVAQGGYQAVVQMDGDGQHLPEYIPRLVDPIVRGEADLVIGSRFLEKKGFQTSFSRRVGISFLRWLIFLLCGKRILDTTSGFRATSARLTAYYAANYPQDYPEPEAIVTALVEGYRVKEVPVEMHERRAGVSSISAVKGVYYMIKVSLAVVLARITKAKRRRAG